MMMVFVMLMKLTDVLILQPVTIMIQLHKTMVHVHMLKLRTIVLDFVLMMLMPMVFVMNSRGQVVQI